MTSFNELLEAAVSAGASDIHISVGATPRARVGNDLISLSEDILLPEDTWAVISEITSESQRETLKRIGEIDFTYSISRLGRFRVNAFRQRGSYSMATRILNLTIPSPEALRIPDSVVKMTEKRRGLVLVTGATGSGKSTTLASLINIINQDNPYHIITLEDPIEYLHRHGRSIVNQREIGGDSESYASALRAALRQDPDVILVGEMRDLETISIAVTAAETGHLVFSTLHTIGAANTIDRIIDVFPPHQQQQIRTQLADVLECVVSQQLIPKKNGEGRVAAMEVMLTNPAIRNHIREAKTYQIPTVMQTNRRLGMITMDDALLDLYMGGLISQQSLMTYAIDKAAVERKI
ncbi:MAG: type IV pilus twitching motility protein PilT [Clostridiales bacterium]|nr:type IV pilus twitching motility protein PilT [Clostridiales bacterium]